MATKRKKDKGASGDNKKAKIEIEVVDRTQYADLVSQVFNYRPLNILIRRIPQLKICVIFVIEIEILQISRICEMQKLQK